MTKQEIIEDSIVIKYWKQPEKFWEWTVLILVMGIAIGTIIGGLLL